MFCLGCRRLCATRDQRIVGFAARRRNATRHFRGFAAHRTARGIDRLRIVSLLAVMAERNLSKITVTARSSSKCAVTGCCPPPVSNFPFQSRGDQQYR